MYARQRNGTTTVTVNRRNEISEIEKLLELCSKNTFQPNKQTNKQINK